MNFLSEIGSEEDASSVQSRLWTLLAERSDCFCAHESTSLPMETAQELLNSICFSLKLYTDRFGMESLLKCSDYDKLLRKSWDMIEEKVQMGKVLLRRVKHNAPSLFNCYYADTIHGIEAFFKSYDYRYFAHLSASDISYQLSENVSEELWGIVYVNDYLSRLACENELMHYFKSDIEASLLSVHYPNFSELCINLFEPIAATAMALATLGKDTSMLNITNEDRKRLAQTGVCARALCERMDSISDELCDYLLKLEKRINVRIDAARSAGGMEGIFPSRL